ncbi:DUF3306 domain-containing protein [Azospirillum halopraeferens]|uniref:DUF3306 domain-containing protein n=1 Tax=Azospirillum halopraeferens TaxID=34010 RepID=UPI0003FFFFBC|nr:DUF3306 domain-containing protein [Azospirillum halopraeferens]
MTDDDGFLARWSRRKQAARTAPPPDADAMATDGDGNGDGEGEAEEAVDPATLPSPDTLGADSDYTVFLKKGVPKALRLAALRRAWASDPAITGHKPLVDYDWDCNAPGYGALRPTDDAKKVVEALFRHLREEEPETDTAVAAADAPPEEETGADDPPRPA